MTERFFRAWVAIALALVAAAPAAGANKEHQQLMADIRMLQEQAQQLQNLIGTLNETLKAVNARLDDQANANRKAFADQKLIIDNQSNDLRVVREKVDDNNVRVGTMSQEVEALRQLVQQALSRATATSDLDPNAGAAGAPSSGTPGSGAPAPTAIGTSPTRAWEMAWADYAGGQYDLAISGFEAYIRDFPTLDKADDAELLIGRSYLNGSKYDKAVEAFDKVIRTYPASNSVPDAYYYKGVALRSLKQADRAREAFEFVAKTYPDSDAGRLAKQLLGSERP